jgi:hypothetical protein
MNALCSRIEASGVLLEQLGERPKGFGYITIANRFSEALRPPRLLS